jgi:GT2 family glycosyltransferase
MKVTAILTCHNRRELTLRCLKSFFRDPPQGMELSAVLVDDGGTDGTSAAVAESFPAVRLVRGDGTYFWAGGMALAERVALQDPPDFLLWLNDDVTLSSGALNQMTAVVVRDGGPSAIVVGALQDPTTGETTYSGLRSDPKRPLMFERVPPAGAAIEVSTMNGNVVLVPREVYESLDGIDGAFAHSQADLDYGLRARKRGFRVMLAPHHVGFCVRRSMAGTYVDRDLPWINRYRHIVSRKGLPPRSLARYLRRHGGPVWPVFWISPYIKLTWDGLLQVTGRSWRGPYARH